jgi:hypothetical protein
MLLLVLKYFLHEKHPWDEADLVMVNDLSDMLLDLVCI